MQREWACSLFGRKLRAMERPVDAVTVAVINLQRAQRAVDVLIQEVIERVSADPMGESSLPDLRVRLAELRSNVDVAADELFDALSRMGDAAAPPETT
jgi:hypothetical protein